VARARGVVGEPWARESRFDDARGDSPRRTSSTQARGVDARAPKAAAVSALHDVNVPAAPVAKPAERIEADPATAGFGLWPTVKHSKMGAVRVDGLPVHFSETDWEIARGGPCLGEHTEQVLTGLLGLSSEEVAKLRGEGVV
jgi:crotonobetainyl-CoA:carnitine CoA-transferase CaiB-like acyl-CoA transferase